LTRLCGAAGIAGMSKKRKDVIIDAILKAQTVQSDPDEYTSDSNDRLASTSATVFSRSKDNEEYKTYISVSCGAASANYPVVGKTVAFVKDQYSEILNIESLSLNLVNGKEVDSSYVLKSTDVLEFVKKAGVKG
jgi:hypothetical protein